jgi:sulfatase maturation enzyme AslB (radical SAM superfamily)
VQTQWFEKSLASSPLRADLDYSNNTQGHTNRTVVDWQIDLGNYCNGACVFCNPESSSRLAAEFKKLGLIDSLPPASWCDDPALVDRFVADLVSSDNLHYLHFIGGETLITPGFKIILSALVAANIAQQITIGFTTNLTVWDQDIVDLLLKFKQVNLGMSVETLTPVNDYVRYPGRIETTRQLLDQWVDLAQQSQWLAQIRITPTCLTVHELSTVYDYAWQHNIAVESCNFLYEPDFLRIGVLPAEYRTQARNNLIQWTADHQIQIDEQVVNTRDPNLAQAQIYQDALSYIDFLETAKDESNRLTDLVDYLKRLESNRKNSILDYLPQYESLFRHHGY